MTIKLFGSRVALVVVLSCLITAGLTSAALAQGGSGQPNVSAEEQSLARAILAAPDPAAKLKAAAELIKKHPKTALRPRVARDMATVIDGVAEASQRLSLAQDYLTIFKEPSEQELTVRMLINAYAAAHQPDGAFAAGSDFLAKNPDALRVLVVLMLLGTDQAKLKNTKFVGQSIQYGAHAIELLEANKKSADMDDDVWQQYKAVLPGMYQSMGTLNLLKGDLAEAKIRLTKAVEMAPSDPFNYLFFAAVLNEQYQNGAKHYKSMPDGPARDDELKRVLASLDLVIDAYAHMIALSEGNQQLQSVRQQNLQDLESYYKYRHNNSTEGMQQLIDKYKVAAKP
jgi:tetratricopeptide (TPR) repeat protein